MRIVVMLFLLALPLVASSSGDDIPRNPSVLYDIALVVEPIDWVEDTVYRRRQVVGKRNYRLVETHRYAVLAVPMGSWDGDTAVIEIERNYHHYSRITQVPYQQEGQPLVIFFRRNGSGAPRYAGYGFPEEVAALARLCNRGEAVPAGANLDSLLRHASPWEDTTAIALDSVMNIVKVLPTVQQYLPDGKCYHQSYKVVGHVKGYYPSVGTVVDLSFETGLWHRSSERKKSPVRNRRNLFPPEEGLVYLYYIKHRGYAVRPIYGGFATEAEAAEIERRYQ